ncbi:MAG: GAF domain-containing protein [Chloroflexi bacterium]|nr:GAF domain-containing protein [Chloroflexota bacterium]
MQAPERSPRPPGSGLIAGLRRRQTQAGTWLRGSLRRWMMLPMASLTVAVVIFGAVCGARFVNEVMAQAAADALRASGQLAAGVAQLRLHDLATHAAYVARLEALAQALRGDDPTFALTELDDIARLHDLEVVVILDATGRPVDTLNDRLGLTTPTGWDRDFVTDPNVQRTIQRQLAITTGEPVAEVGLVERQGSPIFYAIGRVASGERNFGALVLGVSLPYVMQGIAGPLSRPLVVYDAAGAPVFSTFPGSAAGPAGLPLLPSSVINPAADASAALLEARLFAEPYRYVAYPMRLDDGVISYVGVWQPVAPLSAEIRQWQMRFLLVLAASLCLVVGAGAFLTHRVVRNMRALGEAASAIAGGDYARPLPTTGIGELTPLAEVVNQLVGQVQGQITAMHDQVGRGNYLFVASAELGRTLDLDDALQTAAEAIHGLGGLAYVVVLVGRGELGPYTCRAVRGLPAEVATRILGQVYPVPLWGVMARALVSRQPLVIDDVAAQRRPQAGEFDWDVGNSLLLFPVAGASGVSGLFIVGAAEAGRFSADDLGDMVFALARIAANSILNAQLYLEATRSQEQLVTLQMISRVVASATQVEAVLDVVVREAAEMLGDCQAWLFLTDSVAGVGRLHGQQGALSLDTWGSIHQEVVTWVMRAGQPIFYHPDQPLAQSPVWMHTGPAMCVPLDLGENTIGALVIVSRNRQRVFMEDEMIAARTLANSAASALYTAQLAQRLRGMQ